MCIRDRYYLFAGRQYSDGINTAGFSADSFYGKLNITPSRDLTFSFTAGYTDPMNDVGFVPLAGRTTKTLSRSFFATASAEYQVTDELAFKAMGYTVNNAYRNPAYRVPAGTLYRELKNDEDTIGGNLRLIYSGDINTIVAGFEGSHAEVDRDDRMPGRQPELVKTSPDLTKWALFFNDTISNGNFSITLGARFDHNDISGSFISPSLGLTYQVREHTILRAAVARGFTTPPLTYMSGGGRGVQPNPDLKEENVLSYQVGVESSAGQYLSVKTTLFRHDLYDSLILQTQGPPQNTITQYVNNGKVVRHGIEAGVETAPLYNLSLRGAFTFVHAGADQKPANRDKTSWDNYMFNVGIKYDDRNNVLAQLTGTYVWWDLPDPGSYARARYDNFIWDFNGSKRVFTSNGFSGDLFVTVHNLFDSPYYTLSYLPNPRRWVEGGIRLKF
jgi:vitamin B12 transporter